MKNSLHLKIISMSEEHRAVPLSTLVVRAMHSHRGG
jgi:hypothetical protein